jgi:hypothetical protein
MNKTNRTIREDNSPLKEKKCSFLRLLGVILHSFSLSRFFFPIKAQGDLSRGVKLPMSRMVELYFHSPICLHGILLN